MENDEEQSELPALDASIVPQQPDLQSDDVDHWDGGGPWTEIKLDAVMYFVECYTRALTQVGFDLWYVDAFAGSGSRRTQHVTGGILEGKPLQLITETRAGSARRALAIDPPFQHFVFNETNPDRNQILQRLKSKSASRDIQVFDDEANHFLKRVFSGRRWENKARGKARGLVFLDPFALQVEWRTLEMLAQTEAVDVWYLFPLRDVTRQLARRRSGIGPKEQKLDLVLSPAWRDLYSLPPATDTWHQTSLFGDQDTVEETRNSSQRQIENWFKGRLKTIFPFASEPLPLLTGKSRQAFSLFLNVANPSHRAIDLAKHFHGYVMKNFASGASRRMSVL